MTQIAFYAPLKSPGHANPSGDRELARSLMKALEYGGFAPFLVSELRSLDLHGDTAMQEAMIATAEAEIPVLIACGLVEGWRAWVTYHNYYKAPDLLGPTVSAALEIPYVQVESTRARKRLHGSWAKYAAKAEAAADAAELIYFFTSRDAEALKDYAPELQKHVHLRPFLAQTVLPHCSTRQGSILTAAMMRPGDKLASYALIAETMALVDMPWRLDIAGDGTARSKVESLMAPFGDKVRFLGQQNAEGMMYAYANARLLFWPGVYEAIGLTYLEAQAAGIPVLAQDRPGLRDVLCPGSNAPPPEAGAAGLADRLTDLLSAPPPSAPLREHIEQYHLLPAAAKTLADGIMPLIAERA